MNLLTVEFTKTRLMEYRLGDGRLLGEALTELAEQTLAPMVQLNRQRSNWPLGWLDLPSNAGLVQRCLETAQALREECSELVVCGIGGSALGAQAVYAALDWPIEYLLPVEYLDNVDPSQIARLIESVNLAECGVNVISKSGETLETMAGFFYLYSQMLRASSDPATVAQRIVATTDSDKGILRPMAQQQGWRTLPVPGDVGGRFSVFSAVGLLPLAFAGIDIELLVNGAREMQSELNELPAAHNPAWQVAAVHFLLHTQGGVDQCVQYIYGDPLHELGNFFRQLWAESLAKAKRLDGSPGGICLTPLVARGSTDQHSQNQLYMEGPADKLYCFISAEEWEVDPQIILPDFADTPDLRYLADLGFGKMLQACLSGTRDALVEASRPVFEMRLPRIGTAEIGAYLQFWMLATAFAGLLYQVNPFDQPGVERSKVLTRQILGASH